MLASKISFHSAMWRFQNAVNIGGNWYTFVLDGSEQRVNKSGDVQVDVKFHSAKKKCQTMNIVVVKAVKAKKILYLSPSYPGGYNDNQIVRQTKQYWHSNLQWNERGLGDAGFNGMENDLCIDSPPADEALHSVFSSERITIENLFADIKKWKACKYQLRTPPKDEEYLRKLHSEIWTTVAVLVTEYNE